MQLIHIAISLKARGWEVWVVSMLPPQAFTEELEAAGIPVDTLNMHRGVPDPRAIFKLAFIIKEGKPAILHSHMVHANLLSRLTRILSRVPIVICTAHSSVEGGRLREWAYRITDPLCDLTTQVSQAGLERYIERGIVPRHKIRLVPNGVDINRFHPDSEIGVQVRTELGLENKFVWIAVGRFEEAKDYPNLLKAFARVCYKWPEVLLLIVGQGPLKECIKQLAIELAISDKVRFLGTRKDIPGLMNSSQAYVMSSAWEGMPMVLLEAAATGLPIVTTDVGGNHEVVLDGQTGFLVPSKDFEALERAMLQVMCLTPEERIHMGKMSRAYVEMHYSLDKIVDLWEEVYTNMIRIKDI